jgi:hypothetical protein
MTNKRENCPIGEAISIPVKAKAAPQTTAAYVKEIEVFWLI